MMKVKRYYGEISCLANDIINYNSLNFREIE